MIQNETMRSILARRSHRMFNGKPIGDEELRKELIPEGNTVYAAAFFGYTDEEPKDRGERKGTISYF